MDALRFIPKSRLLYHIFLYLLLYLSACKQFERSDNEPDNNLFANETDKLYHHYEALEDSLKLKAAHFLIENSKGLYYYKGEELAHFQQYLKLINSDISKGQYIMAFLSKANGPYSVFALDKEFDTAHLNAEDVIHNIDMAFKVWHEQPWGKHITFDQFCEFILPFRLANAIPEYNREQIYNEFNPLLDTIRKVGGDAVMACKVLNDHLIKNGWLFTNRPDFLPHFPASLLLKYRTGSCRDMADAAVYIMRAVGIPVGIDFLEQWPYRTQGHNWNIVMDSTGKIIMFMGAEESPGTFHKPLSKMGKIYRNTYAVDSTSLAIQNAGSNIIPNFFRNARIKDVTDEYVKSYSVTVKIINKPTTNSKYGYLAVFNNKDWIPIAWSHVVNNNLNFLKLEGGVVYLPCFYRVYGKIEAAGYPLILNKDGKALLLKPDMIHLHRTMTMDRIFPIIPDKFDIASFSGSFQGANQIDFRDAETLYIVNNPMPFWNTVMINNQKKFRYVRYQAGYGKRCSISEIAFYVGNRKLRGQLIGTKEIYSRSPESTMDKAVDGDFSTHFESKYTTGSWIGLDLGSPEKINQIRYAVPCNETKATKIISDNIYELFYWDNNQWISVGKNKGKNGHVHFNNVPSNALYLLFNHSREKEAPKRIFTYDGIKQIWW